MGLVYILFTCIFQISTALLPALYYQPFTSIDELKFSVCKFYILFFLITFAFLNFLCTITICFMVHVEPAYKIICKQLKLQILKSKSINIVYLLEYTDLLYVSVVLLLYAVY